MAQPGVAKPRQAIGATVPLYTPQTLKAPTGLTGSVGSGKTTTTTTMTPLQVYQGDINSDPGSVAAQGIFNAQTSNLAAARADAIQRAIINAGWTPSMTGSLAGYGGDVTPGTLAAAAANPMSQKAQLDLQLQQANQNMPYDLAASGAGRSGAAAIQSGNLQRQYQTASYQGMQDLLGNIYGAANQYAGSYNDAMNQLEAARAAVAARLAQTAGYSQSITTDDGTSGDGSYQVPGYDTAPAPTYYGLAAGTPAVAGSPSTQQAVARVINAIKQPAPRVYQNLRNVMAG